jgi:hypothetical protein
MANYSDIQWNHTIAEETVTTLRQTARLLDEVAHERAYTSRDATDEWRGHYRAEFDHYLEQILNRTMRLSADFRDIADQIEVANRRAYEERQRRQQG